MQKLYMHYSTQHSDRQTDTHTSCVPYPYPFGPVEAAMETHVTIQSFVVLEHATTLRALYRLSRPAPSTHTHTPHICNILARHNNTNILITIHKNE